MPRKLKCYTVMVHGEYYWKGCRVHTVHAVSVKHGIRLLKQATGFTLFRSMYLRECKKCDPQSGLPCCYKLVVQPEYGVTPEGDFSPSSLEQFNLREISPARQKIIDDMQEKRKDLYD